MGQETWWQLEGAHRSQKQPGCNPSGHSRKQSPEQPSVYSLMYSAVGSLQPKQHVNRRALGGRAARQEPGHCMQSVPRAWKPMG